MKKSLLLSLALAVCTNPTANFCSASQAQTAPMAIDPLMLAAAQGTGKDVRDAIASNPKAKADEQTMAGALIIAIACQNKDGVRTLLALGANPNVGIEAAGQVGDHWTLTEALSTVVRAAHAVDTKQDGMTLDRDAEGKVITRSVPKSDAQRTQELARAKEIFELVIAHPKTDLSKKNSTGLSVYTLVHISQAVAGEMEGLELIRKFMTS